MRFHILTLFPDMVEQGLHTSIIGRAVEKSGLRRKEKSSIPERSTGRQTAIYHRGRNRTVPYLYVLPEKSTHRRGTGIPVAG